MQSAAVSPEAALEVCLIAFAVSEAGAGGLGPADAAALDTPVHLWLMEAKHLQEKQSSSLTMSLTNWILNIAFTFALQNF